MIQGGVDTLAQWIEHYSKNDQEVAAIIALFESNEEKLFVRVPPEKPDFELEVPAGLTKHLYLSIVKKIFAVIRHHVYRDIRMIVRERYSNGQARLEVSKDRRERLRRYFRVLICRRLGRRCLSCCMVKIKSQLKGKKSSKSLNMHYFNATTHLWVIRSLRTTSDKQSKLTNDS